MLRRNTHILYIAAAAMAVALSDCASGDELGGEEPVIEPPEAQASQISFGEAPLVDQDKASRAETALKDKYTTFTVWGVKTMAGNATAGYADHQDVMLAYRVEYSAGSAGTTSTNLAGWEYLGVKAGQSMKFWDYAATSYRFFAVAPDANYTSATIDRGGNKYKEITIPVDATSSGEPPYFTNLWFTSTPQTYHDTPVNLQFKQPFAKVLFRFIDADGVSVTLDANNKIVKNGLTEDRSLTEIGLRPSAPSAKIPRKGSIKVYYPIEGTSTQVLIDAVSDIGYALNAFTQPDNWYNVLPDDSQTSYVLEVTYDRNTTDSDEGSPLVTTVPAEYMSWLPNTKYEYVFKLTDSGMEFIRMVQVASTQWTTEQITDDQEFYNW